MGVNGTNLDYTADGVKFYYQAKDGSYSNSVNAVKVQATYAEATLSGLSAGKDYTLYATCTATNGTAVKSAEATFTTPKPAVEPALGLKWLEIPAVM